MRKEMSAERILALAAAASLIFLSGCGGAKEVEPPIPAPKPAAKSVLMIIAKQNFRDEEFAEPRKILERAGAQVTVACSSLQEAAGVLGKVRVKPDITLEQVNATDYDAVIFVGGPGAKEHWDDPAAHRIAREAHEAGKLVCAICIAPVTLANAGVLEGKRATVFHGESATLQEAGAIYTGTSLEQDGTIITADGPKAAAAFGNAIRDALAGQ